VVVEDEQENAAEDEAVVLEEDLSDEKADSAGPVKCGWYRRGKYWQRTEGGWRAGLKGLRVNESDVGLFVIGAVRFGKPRIREHNRRAQNRKEGGQWTAYSRGQSAGARWLS
jgi:hypothetical protein